MEKDSDQKKEFYEIKAKLSVVSGLQFGFGFGIGFFISSMVIAFILFTIFASSINIFLKSVSDPFGIKSTNYQTFSNVKTNDSVNLNTVDVQKIINDFKNK